MDGTAKERIRQIESLQFGEQRQELFCFFPAPVLFAPGAEPFLRFLLRDPKRNDTLRHLFQFQIFSSDQISSAERTACESFILFKYHLGTAAAAGGAEQFIFLYGIPEPVAPHTPKTLLFLLCLRDADRSAAMAAHVHLLHNVKVCGGAALRAVNIRDPVFHESTPIVL